ncbi:hypothetical protein GF362_05120 [Candidatus Dojkabacteria bacterium]|nr:hypothetical protein [Candidatus Dojkabacteria bacterium]
MFNKSSLCKFLVEAKKATYASGNQSIKKINPDKSTTIVYKIGDWKYHDNYFGGEPYGGREVVFYKNNPLYIMTYYGSVDSKVKNIDNIYTVLMNALKLIPLEHPFRGPKKYTEDEYVYTNKFKGKVDKFSGNEKISKNGAILYKASYMGGLVNQRK